MDTEEIKKFLDIIKDTDIEELGWECQGIKISFTRSPGTVGQAALAKPVTEAKPHSNGSAPQTPAETHLVIRAPMVGTFYRASTVDHPPFVVVGSTVTPGQKVAVIEAMKIMKDVTSNVHGRITKILVESGHAVEYGQELFWVEAPETSVENAESDTEVHHV